MLSDNLLIMADGYKYSHWAQYPPNTVYAKSYLEARDPNATTMFFGLQYYLKRYLSQRITREMIDEAEEFVNKQGVTFHRQPWDELVTHLEGRIPLHIEAVPEGTIVPGHRVLMTVRNTEPYYHWLPSFFETLLAKVWYPTTVASYIYSINQILYKYWERTSNLPVDSIYFKLTDFGLRGVSSEESGGIGGAAHLATGQMFTDNNAGIAMLEDYYGAPDIRGTTIPAMEHSTVTSWGREHELDSYRNQLTRFLKPGSYVAMVMDSYDMLNAVEMVSEQLGDMIRESGGTVVFRPDSGYPPDVVVDILHALMAGFGGLPNDKGFMVLDPCVRVIQGDGIDAEMVDNVLSSVADEGFSLDNMLFGSGGALLQKHDRDEMSFAYKTSLIQMVDGEKRIVRKDPATDSGKASLGGDLTLAYTNGFVNHDLLKGPAPGVPALFPVYHNGEMPLEDNNTLALVRDRARVRVHEGVVNPS